MLSEKDLVKGCKECNIKAQQELYERFARKMTAVCYYYTGSSDDAKDLLHEGFIKIFSRIGQYKEEGSLEGWIRRVMVNTAIDFLNKKRSRPDSISSNSIENNSEEDYSEMDDELPGGDVNDFTQEEILTAINKLSDEYRLIFNMFCLERYSHKEIGEKLGIKEDTCRSKLRRARILLREYLGESQKEKTTKQSISK